MTTQDMDYLARRIVALERKHNTAARTAQLPHSSVQLPGGGSAPVAGTLEVGYDNSEDIFALNKMTDLLDATADNEATNASEVSMWITTANDNGINGWQASQAAYDLAAALGSSVDDALAVAQGAVEAAANAQSTADGKNSRRRGQTEPTPPPGGWVQGDQWVVDNAAGTAIEVRVWNGTAFVPEQILASEILVVGPNGVVQLKDGKVTANALAVDALDFKTARGVDLVGGRVRGGSVELLNVTNYTQVGSTTGTAARWTAYKAPSVAPTAGSIEGENVVVLDSLSGGKWTTLNPTGTANTFRFRIWSSVAQRVNIYLAPFSPAIQPSEHYMATVPANEWTDVEFVLEYAIPYSTIGIFGEKAGTINVQSLKYLRAAEETNNGIALYRLPDGKAVLEAKETNSRARMTGGSLIFDNPDAPTSGTITMNGGGIGSYGSNTRMIIEKGSSSPGTGVSIKAGTSPALASAVHVNGDGTGILLEGQNFKFDATGGITGKRPLNVLWTGAWHVGAGQEAVLNDTVDNQLTGIVLAWSRYANNAVANDSWTYMFVPKSHVAVANGTGIYHIGTTGTAAAQDYKKYVYINNTKVIGHANNTTGAAVNAVLRAVYGV